MITVNTAINAWFGLSACFWFAPLIYRPLRLWDCADAQLPAACRWVAHDLLVLPVYFFAVLLLLAARKDWCLRFIRNDRADAITVVGDWRLYKSSTNAGTCSKQVEKSMRQLLWLQARCIPTVAYLAPANGDAFEEQTRAAENAEHEEYNHRLLLSMTAVVLLRSMVYCLPVWLLVAQIWQDAMHLGNQLLPLWYPERPSENMVAIAAADLEAGAENGTLQHAGRVLRNPAAAVDVPYGPILERLRADPTHAEVKIILCVVAVPGAVAAPSKRVPGLLVGDSVRTAERPEDECIICHDNQRTYCCVPCGHYCLCARCAENLRNRLCPGCGQAFVALQRLYQS